MSGSNDNTLKLWDAATGVLVRTFHGHSWVASVTFSPDGRQVLSGGTDTITRLWQRKTGELLAMFGASRDGEWVVLTPEGFFNASSNGADKLLSIVRGLEPHSVLQFFDHLFRPDLIEQSLEGDPEGKYKDAAYHLNLEKVLDSGPAPEIELLKKKTEQAGGSVRLTAHQEYRRRHRRQARLARQRHHAGAPERHRSSEVLPAICCHNDHHGNAVR